MMRCLCLLLISLIIGCAPLVREGYDVDVPEGFKNAQVIEAPELSRWWEDFNDPMLNSLVDEALKDNHDIRLATERVIEARAGLDIDRAGLFPTVDLQADISRQRQSFSASQDGSGVSEIFNTFGLGPVASYELDLWKKLSSAKRASYERLISSIENRKVIIHTVIADLVSLYLQKMGVERKIELTLSRIENNKKTLRVIDSRYKRGLLTYLDLLQARSRLSEVEARLPALRRQSMNLSQRLSIIAGRYPDTIESTDAGIDYLGRLRPVGAGLPSELLLRRPDLRQKEAEMEAVFEELSVARAKRFPQITLTGSYGWSSDELNSLFKPESVLWQVSAGILAPLFDAGRLRASEEAALSRYRQSIIAYSRAVLQAFYEVESALLNRQKLYEEREKMLRLLDDTEKTYRASISRYGRGLVDLLTVLETERQLFQTKERLIDIETAILNNRVFLYRALGGTWTNEEGLYEEME
jgi:multidrug efflux system outer membrane protein